MSATASAWLIIVLLAVVLTAWGWILYCLWQDARKKLLEANEIREQYEAEESDDEGEDDVPSPAKMIHYARMNLTVGVRQDGMIQLTAVPIEGGIGNTLTFDKAAGSFISSALRTVCAVIPDRPTEDTSDTTDA